MKYGDIYFSMRVCCRPVNYIEYQNKIGKQNYGADNFLFCFVVIVCTYLCIFERIRLAYISLITVLPSYSGLDILLWIFANG